MTYSIQSDIATGLPARLQSLQHSDTCQHVEDEESEYYAQIHDGYAMTLVYFQIFCSDVYL
jgi:hypothetical protein